MVGSRAAACLLLLSFLAWPSTASTVEDASQGVVSYQFDGDTHHDAPDSCAAADPAWGFPLGSSTDGMLAPPDDVADAFVVDVPASDIGTRVTFRLIEGPASVDLDLAAFVPDCDGDVFAARNQPVPFPAPPAPASGERQVPISGARPRDACGADWFFLINGLSGTTPPAIHVAWSDGSEASVPLSYKENGEVGIYRTALGAAFTLTGAWANLPATWTGTFKVAHEPCGAMHGGAVYGDPALLGNDLISFTPIRAGPHVVLVTLAPPAVAPPPTAVPMSCHMCIAQLEDASEKSSYTAGSEKSGSGQAGFAA